LAQSAVSELSEAVANTEDPSVLTNGEEDDDIYSMKNFSL
jgi:hypothetical protein